jgi:hypothetical protein
MKSSAIIGQSQTLSQRPISIPFDIWSTFFAGGKGRRPLRLGKLSTGLTKMSTFDERTASLNDRSPGVEGPGFGNSA